MKQLSTPSITPAQIVAVIGAIIGVAIAAGLDISKDLQDSIILLITVLAPVILGADAIIRNGRAKIAAAHEPVVVVKQDADGGEG